MIRTDVAVVGGGPGGVATAIGLARAGRQVVLLDKARFPRDKCCGDGLTTGALRLLEDLGLEPTPGWREVDAAWVRSPSGRTVEFPLPAHMGQFAAVVPRVELDAALIDLARAEGVKVHDGHGFVGLQPAHAGETAIEAEGLGTIAARYVVAADGMWSPVRKAHGIGQVGYLGEWHAFRQYFDHVDGSSAQRLWVWFEPDLLPGYAWSFPLPGGRANVGFGIPRDGVRRVQDMKALWPELLARPHIAEAIGPEAVAAAPHKAWPIPARVDRTVLARGRTLFVGDAARACDPLTGEGIGQALLTGSLAARAIVAAGALRPEVAREGYERLVRREWVPDHRMAAALSRLLRHQEVARGAIRLAGTSDWTRRSFGRWLFEDEPRAAALTPTRWHRQFLGRPGAFAS
ncbi:MAG TPA: NAD(P)/FAD-dependent oxidoreductase [Acidimicrobiales bacterium]|nr:NAD(P)/FAD-dependent oxidoreductase [Acidimicrobiales bacterium]